MNFTNAFYRIGKCPKIKIDWNDKHKEPLNHTAILGIWKNVFDGYTQQMYTECQQVDIRQLSAENSTKLQFVKASQLPKPEEDVFIDDQQVLVFNHHNDSSLAAITHIGELAHLYEDTNYLHHYDKLMLQELDIETKLAMTEDDIDHYEFKRTEQLKQRDHMHDAVINYDRYLHPMHVIDTDYDGFLMVYTCREEQKIPQEHDDEMETFLEDWRANIEEEIHLPLGRIAKDTILKNMRDIRFLDLQQRIIEDTDLPEGMTDADYQNELNEFLIIDPSHKWTFKLGKPTIEQWQKMRVLISRTLSQEEIDEHDREIDPSVPHTFNNLQVQLYVRNGNNLTQDQFIDYLNQLRDKIPGHKFDDTHERIFHTNKSCSQDNIFEHPDRKTYEQLMGSNDNKIFGMGHDSYTDEHNNLNYDDDEDYQYDVDDDEIEDGSHKVEAEGDDWGDDEKDEL